MVVGTQIKRGGELVLSAFGDWPVIGSGSAPLLSDARYGLGRPFKTIGFANAGLAVYCCCEDRHDESEA